MYVEAWFVYEWQIALGMLHASTAVFLQVLEAPQRKLKKAKTLSKVVFKVRIERTSCFFTYKVG